MAETQGLDKVLSPKTIFTDPEILKEYSRDMSFAYPVMPQCIARPKNAKEVQALVRWANETMTPLVPVSSGAPHFRGDTIASLSGVVVDLSAMNKIIMINKRNRVAMVEPGVRFDELQSELNKDGLRLNMPLVPRSSKSVVGSVLEREPVLMPKYQWDVMDPLSCVEVIFGTGDTFRTGTAAGPGSLEEQWQMGQAQINSQGPGQADFSRIVQGCQGSMGIVTWATIRCELLPTLQRPFLVGSESLEKITEFVYQLLSLKLVDECLVLNNNNLAVIVAEQWPEEYCGLRNVLPRWVLFFCIAGYKYFPEERVAYQEDDMRDAAKRCGLEPVGGISGVSAYGLLKKMGRSSDDPYWKIRRKGACQDIFFLTTLDKVQEFFSVMCSMANEYGYSPSDIGAYIQPMVQGTSCHCEFNLFYDPNDAREIARVQRLFERASEALMKAGAFFSRPYGIWADMVYGKSGETANTLRKVKNIFDTNNIMNPGRLCF